MRVARIPPPLSYQWKWGGIFFKGLDDAAESVMLVSMAPTQSPEDILASARMRAAQAMPYFRPAIYKLIPVPSPGLGTFGVTERWHLLWDPGVVADWGVDHVATIILHEIMHPLRDHAARYRVVMGVTKGEVDEFIARPSGTPRAAVQEYMRHHRTWNIVADCFPAGTVLADGLPIEAKREHTLGGNGGEVKVIKNLARPWDGDVVTVKGHGIELTCTPEHPLWLYRRRRKNGPISVLVKDPEWVPAADTKVGDFMLVPDIGGDISMTEVDIRAYDRSNNGRAILKKFPLNEDTAWLLGLYTAEGSGVAYPQLSLGTHEESLISRALEVSKTLGYRSACTPGAHASVVSVRIGSAVLARALHDWCGRGAKNKRIPQFILRHKNKSLLRAYLTGLVDGDGHRPKSNARNEVVLSVTSKALVAQVRLALVRLGVGFNGGKQVVKPREIRGRQLPETTLYTVGWRWKPRLTKRVLNGREILSRSHMWRKVDEGILIPVKAVTRAHYVGTVYNLACDGDHTFIAESAKVHNCEINACLVAAGRKFPEGFCWLGEKLTPPQPRGLLAEEYWAAIDREAPQDPDSGEGDVGESGEPSPGNGPGGDGDSAEGDGDPSGGQCGSGATGVPTPAEEGIPEDNPGRSPAEVRAIIRHAAGQVRKHSQGAGSVPGGLDRWAEEILAPPKVTWDQILRRRMRGGIARVKGAMDTSYSTISRRQQAMGHGPGTVILPASHAYAPRVWVAVDTSASMGPKDVGDALSEVGGILKVVECDVTFSSVDAKVQATTTVRTMRDLASSVRGGGGTDFRPLMKAVDEAREKPHILVVLTDGDGPAPAKPPKGVEIIWVLIGRYKRKPRCPQGNVGYGTFIELD